MERLESNNEELQKAITRIEAKVEEMQDKIE